MIKFKIENLDEPLYPISVVAKLLEIHPQTLRLYEREGLISPGRTKGKTRLYSQRNVERLRMILHLTQERGINLAGVEMVLEFQKRIAQIDTELRRVIEQWINDWQPEPSSAGDGDANHPPKTRPKSVKIRIDEG